MQHVRPPPRRTATWPHVYGHAGARDAKLTRLPSAPLRWSGFATRVVAVWPHATRCTTLCRPARGRSRTRCEASAACRQGMGLFGAYESQRSAQLRGALNEGCPRALSSKDATRRKFGSRVQARNLSYRLLHRNSIHREKYIATASTPPPAPRRPRGKNCMNLERKRAPLQRRVDRGKRTRSRMEANRNVHCS